MSNVELLSKQLLRVSRIKHGCFVAGILSEKCVESWHVDAFIYSQFKIDIIVNVPKESYWTGDALALARENEVATGRFGDLFKALELPNVRDFRSKETEYIERGLRQHKRISNFQRVYDRIYQISRSNLPDVTVAMINEYEVTADHLRTAIERYGAFTFLVMTNPNARATSNSVDVAKSMRIEILSWAEFYGRLNKK